MSDTPQRGFGRFTTSFTSIPAGEVHVAGLQPGSAGSRRLGNSLLTSIAAVFSVSPDTARAQVMAQTLAPAPVSIGMAPMRRFVPRQPARESETEMA